MQGRNWTELIGIKAERIRKLTRDECAEVLQENLRLSLKFGELIDSILNQVTQERLQGNQISYVVRNNPVEREWEATFSTVHMADAPITGLICEGFYLQAIVLLRQEMEGMAQLTHILDGTRLKNLKFAPNIGDLPESIRSLYPDLSQGAHLASHNLAALQAPLANGDEDVFALLPYQHSVIPKYNKHVAKTLLTVHVEFRRELLARFEHYIDRLNT